MKRKAKELDVDFIGGSTNAQHYANGRKPKIIRMAK